MHFETYVFYGDAVGDRFARALIEKARAGVVVRLLYDWLGGLGKTSSGLVTRLPAGGVEVRCYNPPRLDAPLAWLSRDLRKSLVVDGERAFVTGLCVGEKWQGDPGRGRPAWRDTRHPAGIPATSRGLWPRSVG